MNQFVQRIAGRRNAPTTALSLILLSCICVAISTQYNRYFVNKDYVIVHVIPCTAEAGACFQYVCEGDEECDDEPYLKAAVRAHDLPGCTSQDKDCASVEFTPETISYTTIACSDEHRESWEICLSSAPE